jgi:hypothetical protein
MAGGTRPATLTIVRRLSSPPFGGDEIAGWYRITWRTRDGVAHSMIKRYKSKLREGDRVTGDGVELVIRTVTAGAKEQEIVDLKADVDHSATP